jgi:hypothetical protein
MIDRVRHCGTRALWLLDSVGGIMNTIIVDQKYEHNTRDT